jgi:hypothetical protein
VPLGIRLVKYRKEAIITLKDGVLSEMG